MKKPEEIVSPEVAEELKRLGFGVPCLHRYKNPREGAKYGTGRRNEVRNWNNGNHTSAPTNAVALEWLARLASRLFNEHTNVINLYIEIRKERKL